MLRYMRITVLIRIPLELLFLQILPNMLDFLLRLGPAFFEDAVPTVEKSIRSAWRLLLSS